MKSYLFLLPLLLFACQKPKPVDTELKVLGHRGGGIQYGFIENTPESAQFGLTHSEGIEIDLRLSLDGKWMVWHDDVLINAQKDSFRISETKAENILGKTFWSGDSLVQILSLDQFLNQVPLEGKTISLDVKWWGRRPNTWYTDEDIEIGIQNLETLLPSHSANFLLEIDHRKFHEKLEGKIPGLKRYFIEFSNLEAGLKRVKDWGLDGLSVNYMAQGISKKAIEKANQEGIEIMLWTPKDSLSLEEVINLSPNYIQTDYFFQ